MGESDPGIKRILLYLLNVQTLGREGLRSVPPKKSPRLTKIDFLGSKQLFTNCTLINRSRSYDTPLSIYQT